MKALFIDLDGTLTTDHADGMTERQIRSLHRAQQKGIHVVLTTGRNLEATLLVHKKIFINQFARYVICLGGSQIYDTMTGEVIYNETIDYQDTAYLFDCAVKYNLIYYDSDRRFLFAKTKFQKFLLTFFFKKSVVKLYEQVSEKNFLKVNKVSLFYLNFSNTRTKEIFEKIREENPNLFVVNSGGYYLIEATRNSVHKGTAMSLLLPFLGLQPEEVYAFGDSMNDFPMIAATPNFVAVKDGATYLTDNAQHIIDPPKSSGIANFLSVYWNEVI